MGLKGGEIYFALGNGMAALPRTPVVPKATPVDALSAQIGPATVQGDWALTCDALLKTRPCG